MCYVCIAAFMCRKGAGEVNYTVSILPQKYFLEQIVGDKFVVSCMLNEGNNPEAYEPSMTHLINIEKSKAYFCIGYIGFEYAIVGKARANILI